MLEFITFITTSLIPSTFYYNKSVYLHCTHLNDSCHNNRSCRGKFYLKTSFTKNIDIYMTLQFQHICRPNELF